MRVIQYITVCLTIFVALLFVASNAVGTVWAGIDLGSRLPHPFSVEVAGFKIGAILVAGTGICMVFIKARTPFIVASLWQGGRRGASVVSILAALICLAYSWLAVMIALIRLPSFEAVTLLDMTVLAMVWLLIEVMSALLPFVAAEAFKLRATTKVMDQSPEPMTIDQKERPLGPVADFMIDCTEAKKGISIRAKTLYEAYCPWCEHEDYVPLAFNRFGKSLTSLGVSRGKSNGFSVYRDVVLTEVP